MSEFKIKIKMNGEDVPVEKVRELEEKSARRALNVLNTCGIPLFLNSEPLVADKIEAISRSEALAAARESKLAATQDVILEKMKDILEDADKDWRIFSENSRTHENMKSAFIEMEIEGFNIQQFAKYNGLNHAAADIDFAYALNPEHYYFKTTADAQYIIEPLGQYKPCHMKLSLAPTDFVPVALDEDTDLKMQCEFSLLSDGTPMKTIAMHQFKNRGENSCGVKLGLFFPEAAPDALVSGHQEHFLIEFLNAFNRCYNELEKFNL